MKPFTLKEIAAACGGTLVCGDAEEQLIEMGAIDRCVFAGITTYRSHFLTIQQFIDRFGHFYDS